MIRGTPWQLAILVAPIDTMKDSKALIARIISAIVFFVVGVGMQLSLWKTSERTALDALMQHPYLWIIYLILALLAGEHCLRRMKRKSS